MDSIMADNALVQSMVESGGLFQYKDWLAKYRRDQHETIGPIQYKDSILPI